MAINCRERKFLIANKNNFTCQFCQAKVAHADIQIDHMVPLSKGGSDRIENLACTCKKCNQMKGALIGFPASMCEGPDSIDPEWTVLRSFGTWKVKWHFESGLVIEHTKPSYCIPADRAHCPNIYDHMSWKIWFQEEGPSGFLDAIDYMGLFIAKPKESADGD